MSDIVQVILEGVALPETIGDQYSCYEAELSTSLVMAAGNMVKEIKDPGHVWVATYSFDWLDDETYQKAKAVLRSGDAFNAAVLPDNSDTMVSSRFFCTSYTPPTFAFSEAGKPVWHNLGFTLREVEPHA